MMDVERVAAQRLKEALKVPVYLEVPANRPEEFVTVELTGSSIDGGFVLHASLAVQSWAATRRRAAEIARAVVAAVPSIADEPNVFKAEGDGFYRWPDPDSGSPRYQTNVELAICE